MSRFYQIIANTASEANIESVLCCDAFFDMHREGSTSGRLGDGGGRHEFAGVGIRQEPPGPKQGNALQTRGARISERIR